ncbi:hypothetical protein [Actinomadura soli]|nr:hypothetical protein [Actinomadura soli]
MASGRSRSPGYRHAAADFHPFIGSVMSMTVITTIGVPVLKLLDPAGLG